MPRFRRHVTVRYGTPFNVDAKEAGATEGRGRRGAIEAATRSIMTRIAALLPARQRGVYGPFVDGA